MDLLDALLPAAGDDALLPLVLLVLAGFGLLAMPVFNALRDRREVRRRATEGYDRVPSSGPAGAKRREAQRSLERLMIHLETTFAPDAKQNRVLRQQLILAGFYDQRAVALYFAARVAAAALGLGLALAFKPVLFGEEGVAPTTPWLFVGGTALAGYLAPSFYLGHRTKRRAAAHRAGFPDFMDLMVVCSEAGLSMESAVERIARELVEGYPSLAENLYMTSLEIRAGKSFSEGLEGLGRRLGIEEAKMLSTLLQQSAELGTSLSQSLRVYSDEMRNKRMSRAEEKAYALPAKLVVPLTIFVFPVLLVTIMLPVIVKVSQMMGG